MRWSLRWVVLGAWIAAMTVPAGADTAGPRWERLATDDFGTDRGQFETLGGNVWKVCDGALRFRAAPEAFAVLTIDELDQVEVRAAIVPDGRDPRSFATAGLALYGDAGQHWRLLLVASPDNKPYFELIETFHGVHQAQSALSPPGMKLTGKNEGTLHAWEYGHRYELSLRLTRESICGEVRDPDSKQFWRRTYLLGQAKALRAGRPGLAAGGLEGRFDDLAVDGVRPDASSTIRVARGPAGSVALIEDASGTLAPWLKGRLEQRGFQVQVVAWDALRQKRLTADSADVVVLADARRVPAFVARACANLLHVRGKLLAIGAPAFSELLYRTPKGYVARAEYQDHLYESLPRQALPVTRDGWRRAAMDPKRPGSLEPVADEPGTWKASVDLNGWDLFVHNLKKGFGDGRPLLCFEARGDENTSQLSIECNEQDGSRWIATVPLTPQWGRYLLRPSDFANWHDAKAKRGGPGDTFRPEQAASVRLGLSSSHTPQCRPGPHAFWFRNLATAPDVDEQPLVSVPQIETMAPSYQLYPLESVCTLRPAGPLALIPTGSAEAGVPWPEARGGYSSVWRERGLGFDRHRPWRWMSLVDAFDAEGHRRGSLLWLMLGQTAMPGALWGNLGLADPQSLRSDRPENDRLGQAVAEAAQIMARGVFLAEAGARHFSYPSGEPIQLGAELFHGGSGPHTLSVRIVVQGAGGQELLARSQEVRVAPGQRPRVSFDWRPAPEVAAAFPLHVRVTLEPDSASGTAPLDRLEQDVDLLPGGPAPRDEFVRVEGSQFVLHGKPWQMLGMNYRPTSQGGRATIDMLQRSQYDPEVIERDLTWMAKAGINTLSAIQGRAPEDPDAPGAYRDVQDFLNRCHKHGMKVFFFLPWGNPLAGGRVEEVEKYLTAAGIRRHPAILAWELSWEPIYHAGSSKRGMEFLVRPWNAWIAERYGSLDEAERDWDFRLDRVAKKTGPEALAEVPPGRCFTSHGPWDRAAAAFRRFFSDYVGQQYGAFIARLRRFDPDHLITFRFGACGIPNAGHFAHAHSAGVARHVDFLCPEGYNLQLNSPARPAPDDEIRKGGLVTLFYRFLGREKPVVWMEFGYTVQGIHTAWQPEMVHVRPAELEIQRQEFERFYAMFLESGAQGAAPWWLPGGFRLGENSDFGILEPDGSERPACEVLKKALPQFASLPRTSVVAAPGTSDGPVIDLDLDAHYPDAWAFYGPQYLDAVRAGRAPRLRTPGTGTTSADCPLTAVGNVPCTGRNPPLWLNAECVRFQIRWPGQDAWRDVGPDETIAVPNRAAVEFRMTLANTAEATWLSSRDAPAGSPGHVRVACRTADGLEQEVPIRADTPYLHDAEVEPAPLPLTAERVQTLRFQAMVWREQPGRQPLKVPFGQTFVLHLKRGE